MTIAFLHICLSASSLFSPTTCVCLSDPAYFPLHVTQITSNLPEMKTSCIKTLVTSNSTIYGKSLTLNPNLYKVTSEFHVQLAHIFWHGVL